MKNNFWLKLKPPIVALAPLAGFTDSAFRQICHGFGADVLYSEMISAAALYYGRERGSRSAEKTWDLLKFNRRRERPFVVQLFGSHPEHFALAARLVSEKIKPDGIDINCGCPVPKVMKAGAGAALMSDPPRARAVLEAVLKNTNLPVSLKIRAAVGSLPATEFLKNLADLPLSAVMIHARSLSQSFSGSPDWGAVKKARSLFKGIILANGGIKDLASARRALNLSGADGLGLARGALSRPWLFKEIKEGRELKFGRAEIFKLILRHAAIVQRLKEPKGLVAWRQHLAYYVKGLAGARKLRTALVKVTRFKDLKNILS